MKFDDVEWTAVPDEPGIYIIYDLALSRNGPPPIMSITGSNDPGPLNSTVVPKASPTANPSKHPRSLLCNISSLAIRKRRRSPDLPRLLSYR